MAVDTRKLKDSVSELFKKGKFEKASAALEDLIKAEPRETQHRLKLGDALRKSGERERAIVAYQAAAKAYADEGQLIKAIAAVKVILEIDPANEAAQAQLAEMNERRFAKPGQFAQKAAPPKSIGNRGVSAIELDDGAASTSAVSSQLSGPLDGPAPFQRDTEALELDEPEPPPPRRPSSPPPRAEPPRQQQQRTPPSARRDADELDAIALPEDTEPEAPAQARRLPSRRGQPLSEPLEPLELDALPAELDLVEVQPEPELLDLDLGGPGPAPGARVSPPAAAAQLSAEPESVEIELMPADAGPNTAPIKVMAAAPPVDEQRAQPSASVEIDLALAAPRPKTGPQPIADLLIGSGEEEVELLSISSDEELAPAAPQKVTASGEDLDQAFSGIEEHPQPPPRKIPARVPLFSELSPEAFVELVNRLDYRVYEPGQVILREGDPGRSFYVISEGRVRVYKQLPDGQQLTLAHLDDGAFFGEMALLSGAPRTATIAAEVETHLLEVSDKVLRSLVAKHPQVTVTLKNFYRQRLLNNVMAISPLFKGFDAAERKTLMERFKMRQAAPGEVLIEQGKKADGLYVVLHGSVNVTAKAASGAVDIAKLREGDIFGEMSMLTHQPSIATVAAAVPSLVLKLPRGQFVEMISTHPQILELVSELTDQRRSATEAILRGQGPGVDGMAFV